MIVRPNASFIMPARRFVEVGMPKSPLALKGRYMLIKRDAFGIELDRTPWFDNLILNSGLNRWGTAGIIVGAAIGTGTSTPNVSQTALDSESHYTTTAGTGGGLSIPGSTPYNNTRTFVYRTTLGALNGNYTEVGVGWASGFMFSRALILDGGGSPTTISVTSAQQLDIVYQLSIYPPLVDTGPDVVTISGVDYDVTGRAMLVNTTDWWGVNTATPGLANGTDSLTWGAGATLGAITASVTGTAPSGAQTASTDSYSSGSYTKTGSLSYSLTQGNAAGGIQIAAAWWFNGGGLAGFKYLFDPVIPKDSTKTLVLNYSITWARRP